MLPDGLNALIAPKGKTRALVQFNKISGAFVSVMSWVDPATLNQDYYEYRETEIDFANEYIKGDLSNWEVARNDSRPEVITEELLDLSAQQRITKEYPVVKQVNIIARAVQQICAKLDIQVEELEEMIDYISEVKRTNQVRKEFYRDNPDFEYWSYEDVAKEEAKQLEGGLHEAYGGRPITGGSVF